MLTEENIGKTDAKLGDFGMSRQLYHGSSYYRMSDRLFPIAWYVGLHVAKLRS